MTTAIASWTSHMTGHSGYEPVSDGSRAIQRTWAQERNYLRNSAPDWQPIVESALREIRAECDVQNWDGLGAAAVMDRTVTIAASVTEALFAMLPKSTPAPDLIPEGDGEIGISWVVDTGTMFSVSVGAHGKINYAGQFGRSGSVHAWQVLDTTSEAALEESLRDVVRYVGKLYSPALTRRAA